VYLEEILQILAPPGKYKIRIELLDTDHAGITLKNLRIDNGPAVISPKGEVHIYTPERPQ
jgi:hypothetical protein